MLVIVASDTTAQQGDTSHLEGCLEALSQQSNAPTMEIIVPFRPPLAGLEAVTQRFPNVMFVPVERLKTACESGPSREHHDELRAHGLVLARGDVIALLEDHDQPAPNWAAAVMTAHTKRYAGYAGVGGAVENGIDRSLNWAVYFCDFGRYQIPVSEGDAVAITDVNSSYKRVALEAIRPVWCDVFHEVVTNDTLTARGGRLALTTEIVVYQHRLNLRLRPALIERYVWGRSYAATRCRLVPGGRRAVLAALTPALPIVLLYRMAANVIRKRRRRLAFVRALPLIALCTMSWSLGELLGYLTARPHRAQPIAAEAIAAALHSKST